MKYIIVLADGMADEPIESLNNQTPMEVANKPNISELLNNAMVGLVDTIPKGMSPGSDIANLSVLGYRPDISYTGRSPLEAVSVGVPLSEEDVTFRCNFVTLTEEESYWNKKILDHSAEEITTEEADVLVKAIEAQFGTQALHFFTGTSYRHILRWHLGSLEIKLTQPHDILGKQITAYGPQGKNEDLIREMMEKSYEILNNHPINVDRRKRGLRVANSIWLWGGGTKPSLESFENRYGLKGTMISAVDLLKGIGLLAEMDTPQIIGATGNLHTNFVGKAQYALESLQNGNDFVFVHLEAPDECGHQGDLPGKIKSIELIDQYVIGTIVDGLKNAGMEFRLMMLPDHPTPIKYRTHTKDPVPFFIYDSRNIYSKALGYSEKLAKDTGVFYPSGESLMNYFLEK